MNVCAEQRMTRKLAILVIKKINSTALRATNLPLVPIWNLSAHIRFRFHSHCLPLSFIVLYCRPLSQISIGFDVNVYLNETKL